MEWIRKAEEARRELHPLRYHSVRHCARQFSYTEFLQQNFEAEFSSTIYKCGHRGSDKLNDLSKSTDLVAELGF